MKLEEFAKEIQKKNEIDSRWKWLSYLLLYPLLMIMFDDEATIRDVTVDPEKWVSGCLLMLVVMIFFTMDFVHQYFYFKNSYFRFPTLSLQKEQEDVIDVMRMHAFSVDEYFAMIRKKMYPWLACWVVLVTGEGVLFRLFAGVWTFRIFMVLLALVPFPVLWLMKKYAGYRLTHEKEIKHQIPLAVLEAVHGLLEGVIVLVVFFISGLLLWSFVGGLFGNYDFSNERDLVIRQFQHEWLMTGMYFLLLVFILSVMISIKKKARVIRLYLLGILLFYSALAGAVAAYCYTDLDFTDKTIEVHDLKQTKKYGFEDIVKYELITSGRTAYQSVTIFLSDGSRVLFLEGNNGYSDAYGEVYQKDADFLKDLEKEFNKRSIPNTVADYQ